MPAKGPAQVAACEGLTLTVPGVGSKNGEFCSPSMNLMKKQKQASCQAGGSASLRRKRKRDQKLCGKLDVPNCDCPVLLSCPCGEACIGEAAKSCKHCRGECDCPPRLYQPPCIHVRKAIHYLTLEQWADFLSETFAGTQDHYEDPPTPERPGRAMTREARVELMAERVERGESLYHPDDLIGGKEDLKVEVEVQRLRNGALDPEETVRKR